MRIVTLDCRAVGSQSFHRQIDDVQCNGSGVSGVRNTVCATTLPTG